MAYDSPLNKISVPPELVLEFFSVFSRFEYALKANGYLKKNTKNAEPDWVDFANKNKDMFGNPEICKYLSEEIKYLLEYPPEKQVIVNEVMAWKPHVFKDSDTVSNRVLKAVTIVRNNLFHGGKYSPHSPPGRDERLIKSSLAVIYHCLNCKEDLRIEYEAYP